MADVPTDVRQRLEVLDRRGYTVFDAITFDNRQSQTLSRTCVFVCSNGKSYWAKAASQQGLVAELICGRLANKLHSAPGVAVIRVTADARPPTGDCDHIDGVVFGSHDMPSAENARDIGQQVAAGGGLLPVDALSRARVVAFQTWIGVADAQVLVRLTDGRLFSLDHGDAFGAPLPSGSPSLQITDIPGVDRMVGQTHANTAASEIEAMTDEDIVQAVSMVPIGPAWRSDLDRRVEIATFLIDRRPLVRQALRSW